MQDAGQIILLSLVIIALLVVGSFVVMYIRRQMKEEDAPTKSIGFTLDDLREMHRKGQLSDEEFARAKFKVVESAQRQAARRGGGPPQVKG